MLKSNVHDTFANDFCLSEEFRDEKLVQKIRESSEELRELEEKLKAAYMTKERKAQIAEKQIVSQIRGEEESKLDMMMEEDRRRGVHMDAKEQYMRKSAALEAQGQLEEQILEHEHQKVAVIIVLHAQYSLSIISREGHGVRISFMCRCFAGAGLSGISRGEGQGGCIGHQDLGKPFTRKGRVR